MVTLVSPLSTLAAQFPILNRSVAAFDFDDTLVPNTGWGFLQWLYPNHPRELVRGPFNLARIAQGGIKLDRPYLERLRDDTTHPRYNDIFAAFAQLTWHERIFTRTAEAWAWHRANLQRMVLITGAFEVAAKPFLGTLHPDHLFINDTIYPVPVTAYKKPGILNELFESEDLSPHTVYTDSYADRHMLEKIQWQQVHVIQPKRKMQELAEQRGWSILSRNESNKGYPSAVRDYARRVIRSSDPRARFHYYDFWSRYFSVNQDAIVTYLDKGLIRDVDTLFSLTAVAGLWIKERPEVQQELRGELSYDLQDIGARLYARVVRRSPEAELPLTNLNTP